MCERWARKHCVGICIDNFSLYVYVYLFLIVILTLYCFADHQKRIYDIWTHSKVSENRIWALLTLISSFKLFNALCNVLWTLKTFWSCQNLNKCCTTDRKKKKQRHCPSQIITKDMQLSESILIIKLCVRRSKYI